MTSEVESLSSCSDVSDDFVLKGSLGGMLLIASDPQRVLECMASLSF